MPKFGMQSIEAELFGGINAEIPNIIYMILFLFS